jgi:hypothetical protein
MWPKRSEILAPLSTLTSNTKPFVWKDEHQKAFEEIKKIIVRETLLSFPDFTKVFEIHTDASHTQLGSVISQEGKPLAFYSRKLNPTQTRYTTTEWELLAIVETLKEFRNILFGQQIRVFTDHQNLTYKNFNTERVMRWRLILEEFGPELIYLPGEENIVADALSRLDKKDDHFDDAILAIEYCLNANDVTNGYPLSYQAIFDSQQSSKELPKYVKEDKSFEQKVFHGGGKSWKIWCQNEKLYIPKDLRMRIVNWYHETLCHPGANRTEETIRQHFTWGNM